MQINSDTSTTGHPTRQTVGNRYNIPEAAKILSLTEEAVRQRVKRGTLDSIKVDGKLFVLLDTDTSSDTLGDQEQPVIDTSTDTSRLVDALESEIAHLRRQLEQANERDRENRRIIAALTQRIPELEPVREPTPAERESPVTASEDRGDGEPRAGAEKLVERRSWWRKVFGV